MPKKAWTSPDQVEWLEARKPKFLEAQSKLKPGSRSGNSLKTFFAPVYKEWEERWPHPAPTATQIKEAGGDVETAKAQVGAFHINRVYYWFFNHTRETGSTVPAGGPKHDLLKLNTRRRLQPYLVYLRLYKDSLKVLVDDKWKAHLATVPTTEQKDRIAFATQVYHEEWSKASADVKEQVEKLREELFSAGVIDLDIAIDAEVEEGNVDDNGASESKSGIAAREKMLNEMQRAIDRIPATAKKVLASITAQTGWPCSFICGGAMPRLGGELKIFAYHSGETKDTNETFEHASDTYEAEFIGSYDDFVQRCFPEDICPKFALPGASLSKSSKSPSPHPDQSTEPLPGKAVSPSTNCDKSTDPLPNTVTATPASTNTSSSNAEPQRTPNGNQSDKSTEPLPGTVISPSTNSDKSPDPPPNTVAATPATTNISSSNTESQPTSHDNQPPPHAPADHPPALNHSDMASSEARDDNPDFDMGDGPMDTSQVDGGCVEETGGGTTGAGAGAEALQSHDADADPGADLLEKAEVPRMTQSNSRKPPPSDPNASGWHKLAEAHLLSLTPPAGASDGWRDLVHYWLGIEQLLAYPTAADRKQYLAVKSRPSEFKAWTSKNKKLSYIPPFKVSEFAVRWRVWWESLQPVWRDNEDWPPHRDVPEDEDWLQLRKGGPNGLFHVIISLTWWAAQCHTKKDRLAYTSAQEDVVWVLQLVYSYLADLKQAGKSTTCVPAKRTRDKPAAGSGNSNKRRRLYAAE